MEVSQNMGTSKWSILKSIIGISWDHLEALIFGGTRGLEDGNVTKKLMDT